MPEPKTVKHRMHLDVNVGSVAELDARSAPRCSTPTSFRWTLMADPEGGEFCAFVREGEIAQRLYEIGVDTADSADDAHRIARLVGRGARRGALVDNERGFSYVDQVPGAPFDSLDFVPVPEPKTVKNRIHLDVTHRGPRRARGRRRDRAARPQDDEIGWTVLADPDGNEFCAFVA